MGAPRKYPDWVYEEIGRLSNDEHKTGPEIARIFAAGVDGHEPLTLVEDYIREIARNERRKRIPPLDDQPLGEAIDTLARRTLGVVATEITRLQAKNGALDADQILKLAKTIKELHPLAQAKSPVVENAGTENKPPPWLRGLEVVDEGEQESDKGNGGWEGQQRALSSIAPKAV
jgi:hypothetical protein